MQAYASTIQDGREKIKLTAENFNKSLPTTQKYLKMSPEEIQSINNIRKHKDYSNRTSVFDYMNIIYKMLRDGYNQTIIHNYIISKGYTGSKSVIKNAIVNISINNFGTSICKTKNTNNHIKNTIVISRNDLLKEITAKSPTYKHDKIIQENMNLIVEKYPIVKTVAEIFDSFYSTIMGDKPEQLDTFIETYETKKESDKNGNEIITYQSPISSFIEGLKKDITPARNAISFSESSGFVEGNNNKFKLIKRILYGRANLVNLFRKCYLCFLFKKENFSLKKIISLTNEK